MTLAGIGAGVNELTALAATSELAPTAKRGKYVAILVFTIIPFCPSVMWGQLIAYHAGWRWCGLLCGIWAFIGFVLTLIFYFPPPRVNSLGLSKREIIGQIDFIGGLLSISGMILFMAGMQWGGYQVRPSSLFFTSHMEIQLTTHTVLMENSSRPRSAHSGSCSDNRIFLLGSLRSQISHVSQTS